MGEVKKCLVIDDDQDDQEIFLLCLNKIGEGVDCRSASNGADAITMLQSDSDYIPNYIFVDVNMPKMNGIECLKVLKTIKRLRLSKIFMYSTTSEGAALAESKILGADDFIIKPSRSGELKETLSKIFEMVTDPNT